MPAWAIVIPIAFLIACICAALWRHHVARLRATTLPLTLYAPLELIACYGAMVLIGAWALWRELTTQSRVAIIAVALGLSVLGLALLIVEVPRRLYLTPDYLAVRSVRGTRTVELLDIVTISIRPAQTSTCVTVTDVHGRRITWHATGMMDETFVAYMRELERRIRNGRIPLLHPTRHRPVNPHSEHACKVVPGEAAHDPKVRELLTQASVCVGTDPDQAHILLRDAARECARSWPLDSELGATIVALSHRYPPGQ